MKILFVSNLFPDAANPQRGIYNARLVKHLGALCELRVVSPRPTRGLAPFWSPKEFFARVEDAAFAPTFPPTAYFPKIGGWNHKLMARSLRGVLRQVRAKFPFDVALASWVYPDACAIARLAREMDFPFVAIAQGSDVHQYLEMPGRRRVIVASLAGARAVITRSAELGRLLAGAGVASEKLHTIYNGVEQEVFKPGDKSAARAALGLARDETVLLYVGNLLPIKNPLLLVRSFAELNRTQPDKKFRLAMVGNGPLRTEIARQAMLAGLGDKIVLAGLKAPAEIARLMQAADVLCVPSDNEGVPNVIYEALSCGLRVVATRVGGIPEIVREDFLGRLVAAGNAAGLAQATAEICGQPAQTELIVNFARQFSWEQTAATHLRLLAGATSKATD